MYPLIKKITQTKQYNLLNTSVICCVCVVLGSLSGCFLFYKSQALNVSQFSGDSVRVDGIYWFSIKNDSATKKCHYGYYRFFKNSHLHICNCLDADVTPAKVIAQEKRRAITQQEFRFDLFGFYDFTKEGLELSYTTPDQNLDLITANNYWYESEATLDSGGFQVHSQKKIYRKKKRPVITTLKRKCVFHAFAKVK